MSVEAPINLINSTKCLVCNKILVLNIINYIISTTSWFEDKWEKTPRTFLLTFLRINHRKETLSRGSEPCVLIDFLMIQISWSISLNKISVNWNELILPPYLERWFSSASFAAVIFLLIIRTTFKFTVDTSWFWKFSSWFLSWLSLFVANQQLKLTSVYKLSVKISNFKLLMKE